MSRPRQGSLPGCGAEDEARPQLVVSASRRTDLPGFYPERLVDRLRGLLDRRGADLYGLVLWTRHPRSLLEPPLRALLEREVPNVALNVTVTGLGGSPLEPGAPDTASALAALEEAVDVLGGEPARIRWRFDPLLFGLSTRELFLSIAEPLSELGVPTVTVSFPSTMSLKGPLGPQYAAAGIEPWPGLPRKVAHAGELLDAARGLGMRFLACCQPKIVERVPGIEPARCIPAEVLETLHPEGLPISRGKDRTQRRHCRCAPSVDIGSYADDRCLSGCAYCYSRAGGP